MNKTYLLVICLLLTPFTGCIDIEEPELEEEWEDLPKDDEEKTEKRPTEQWTFYRDFVECNPNNDSIVAYDEFVDCLNMDLVNDGESVVTASSEFAHEVFNIADLDMDGNLTSSEFDYIENYPHEVEKEPVKGCMDMNATNYNSTAEIDDGSCEYPPAEGCMDSNATNYNSTAEIDDGSCEYPPVEGCMDSDATNYDSTAEIDDGSCEYPPVEGCMDSDATNYDSEAEVDDGSCEYPDTCPSGSTITGDTGDAGYANPGVVFSENSNLPDEHDPKRIMFTVTLNGGDLEDCIVKSEIDEGNGWFFSSNNRTNSDGEIYGYWTAGSEIGLQTMRAYVTWPDGEKKYANVTGEVSDTSSRTNSIHLNYYPSGTYDSFSVQATPGTGPAATYYSTINWRGAYGGIQFDGSTTKVIFSTWDANEMDAEIRDSGDCNDVVDFGGEGTGVSCRLLFPPSEHGAIPGLPDDYMLVPGHTYDTTIEITDCGTNCQDYSFNFTDVTRGFGPISLGTQRYKDDAPNDYASSFVEEWTPHGNCLSAERSVLYHDIKARVDGVWETIDTARFTPNYYPSNNEICANYFAEGTELGFQISSGGDRLVGPPRIDGDSAFPNTRYLYLVEN